MKKNLIIIVIILIIFTQIMAEKREIFVNKINVKLLKVEYLEAVLVRPSFGIKKIAYIDYGQERKSLKKIIVTDKKGVKIKFISLAEFLNEMYRNNWIYLETYVDTKNKVYSNKNHMIFRRNYVKLHSIGEE